MTGKKESAENTQQPIPGPGKQVKDEMRSDGSANAFDETEQVIPEVGAEITDQHLDEWLDE